MNLAYLCHNFGKGQGDSGVKDLAIYPQRTPGGLAADCPIPYTLPRAHILGQAANALQLPGLSASVQWGLLWWPAIGQARSLARTLSACLPEQMVQLCPLRSRENAGRIFPQSAHSGVTASASPGNTPRSRRRKARGGEIGPESSTSRSARRSSERPTCRGLKWPAVPLWVSGMAAKASLAPYEKTSVAGDQAVKLA